MVLLYSRNTRLRLRLRPRRYEHDCSCYGHDGCCSLCPLMNERGRRVCVFGGESCDFAVSTCAQTARPSPVLSSVGASDPNPFQARLCVWADACARVAERLCVYKRRPVMKISEGAD